MPKPTKGKRLGGSSSHEDQIISNLISSLIEHEKIIDLRNYMIENDT